MARVKPSKQVKYGESGYKHPYMEYEGTLMWSLVRKGIRDLVNNKDLIEIEDQRYIVGYLCKVISEGQKQSRVRRSPARSK